MAKKGSRMLLHLVCEKCKEQNYMTERNKVNTTEKLAISKYCRRCQTHTNHKESTKLK